MTVPHGTAFADTKQRQFSLITAMRFPLIMLVLYEHSVGAFAGVSTPYGFVSELISHHICPIAVCWFFVFSGFLFFQHAPETFSFNWIVKKWKKRVLTLLVPYLIWNLLYVAAILLKNFCFEKTGLGASQEELAAVHQGPYYWFIAGPVDFPLWYILALMKMTLLTPLLWLFFKWFRSISPFLLIILYLFGWGIPFYIDIKPLFYFSMGAWLGIRRIDMRQSCKRIFVPAAFAAFVLLIAATLRTGHSDHEYWARLCWPFAMITFMNICDRLNEKPERCDRLCRLAAPVFFIYAAHEIYILGWTKGVFVRVFGEGMSGTWIRFIFVPLVVLLVCLAIYQLLNRFVPKTLAFACGGRTKQ